MRHSLTNRDQRDDNKKDFDHCSSQRNLSDEGRKLAEKIGEKIKDFEIPIGKVLSSPYCRCKETAELTFGSYTIEKDLQFSMSKKPAELKMLGDRLKQLMQNTTTGKDNTVFVGHTSNLREGLGIWPKPEAVIAVFKKVDNDVLFKGFIKPNDWK
jgi:phosphohistidine phosphatase SixA